MLPIITNCGYDPYGRTSFQSIESLDHLNLHGSYDISDLVHLIVTQDFKYRGTDEYALTIHNNQMVLELWNNGEQEHFATLQRKKGVWTLFESRGGKTNLGQSPQISFHLRKTLEKVRGAWGAPPPNKDPSPIPTAVGHFHDSPAGGQEQALSEALKILDRQSRLLADLTFRLLDQADRKAKEAFQQQNLELQRQLERQESLVRLKDREIQDLTEQADDNQRTIAALRQENDQITDQLNQLQEAHQRTLAEQQALQVQLDKATQQTTAQQQELEKQQQEQQALRQEIDQLFQKSQAIEAERSSLEKELEEATHSLEQQSAEKVASLQEKIDELEKLQKGYEKRQTQLDQELSGQDHYIAELREALQKTQSENEHLQQQLQASEQNQNNLSRQVETLNQRVQTEQELTNHYHTELKKEIDLHKATTAEFRKALGEWKNFDQETRDKFDREFTQLNLKNEQLQTQLRRSKEDVERLQDHAKTVSGNLADMETKNRSLLSQNKSTEKKLEEVQAQLSATTSSIEQLEVKKAALMRALQEQDDNLRSASKHVETVSDALAEMETKNRSLTEENKNLLSQQQLTEEALEQVQAELSAATSSAERLESEKQDLALQLETQNEDFEDTLKEVQVALDVAKASTQHFEAERESLINSAKASQQSLELKNKELQKTLDNVEKIQVPLLEDAMKTIEDISRKLARAEEELDALKRTNLDDDDIASILDGNSEEPSLDDSNDDLVGVDDDAILQLIAEVSGNATTTPTSAQQEAASDSVISIAKQERKDRIAKTDFGQFVKDLGAISGHIHTLWKEFLKSPSIQENLVEPLLLQLAILEDQTQVKDEWIKGKIPSGILSADKRKLINAVHNRKPIGKLISDEKTDVEAIYQALDKAIAKGRECLASLAETETPLSLEDYLQKHRLAIQNLIETQEKLEILLERYNGVKNLPDNQNALTKEAVKGFNKPLPIADFFESAQELLTTLQTVKRELQTAIQGKTWAVDGQDKS